jgi:hypothetical protein
MKGKSQKWHGNKVILIMNELADLRMDGRIDPDKKVKQSINFFE